jgi:60 kDa SS-A/Ro ribonucleoprotein
MAMAIAKREPNHFLGAFNHTLTPLNISPNMRLDQALNAMKGWMGGSTDCAAPMVYAKAQKMSGVDKFVVITDNETWAVVSNR